MFDEYWASPVRVNETANQANEHFRVISSPLSEISGREILLPVSTLGRDTGANILFSFGIWSIWISCEHGLLALNKPTGNILLASLDADCGEHDAGVLIYNRKYDCELLVTDSGVGTSPLSDFNQYFEMLCGNNGCDCGGLMVHNSTFPWQTAVVCHDLVTSESSNTGAADKLAEMMMHSVGLEKDVAVAWKSESDEGNNVWWHCISNVATESLFLTVTLAPGWVQVWHISKYRSRVGMYSSNSSVISGLRRDLGRNPLINLAFETREDVYC